jgi:CHAD domain-containing protein
MTLELLLTQYNTDVAHTRYVADLSLVLFDSVQEVYELPRGARDLMELGALLHDVGLSVDESKHNLVGRDIVLRTDLSGLDADKRAIVACIVSFHRKKVRPESEPSYLRLKKKDRQLALSLASLLRVADGLDYSHTQSTRLLSCEVDDGDVTLQVDGPYTDEDAHRAVKKADLWRKVFGSKVNVAPVPVARGEAFTERPAPGAEVAPGVASEPALQAPLTSTDVKEQSKDKGKDKNKDKGKDKDKSKGNGKKRDTDATLLPVVHTAEDEIAARQPAPADSLAEEGRELLRHHFRKFLAEEDGVREDSDIEHVHDMRVATRRMRAILPVMEHVAQPDAVRKFRKQFKKTASALGDVRDCDVFMDQVSTYLSRLPEEQRDLVKPLTDALHRDRAEARVKLLKELDSKRYAGLKSNFAAFITNHAEQWDTTLRIRDVVGSILWQRYEQLQVHEHHINLEDVAANDDDMLHQVRIDGKRLRYILELLSTRFEEHVVPLLKQLKEMQDCLGALQDIAVAKEYVATLKPGNDAEQAALDTYVASREEERARWFAEFPGHWQALMGQGFRRSLADLLVRL